MTIKKQPQIRFGGFGGDWEEKKFIEVSPLQRGFDLPVSKIVEGEYPVVFSNGILKTHNEYKVKGVGIVTGRSGTIGKVTFVEQNFWPHNTALWVTDFCGNDPKFIYQMIKKLDLSRFATGSGVPTLNRNDVHDQIIRLPEKPEQIAIGQFFRQLDEMLTLAEQKHAQTVQLKKALLGKLFPISGSRKPQIRLKGFSGDWVERKLGDLGECMSGIGFPENEQGGKSGIPFYKVSDMNLPENNIFLKTANNFVTDEQIQQNNWKVITSVPCIFFAKVGAALLLNRKRLVTTPFLLDNNTMAFVIGLELHDYFAKILFDNIDLPKISQVGALPSINAKDVENIIVRLPETLAEQTAIGKLFQTLDHTIALQAKEITQIKQLKSALLGKMFV